MDRRYRESRFYSGVPASRRSEQRRESITRQALSRARAFSRSAERYGGSTGGNASAGGRQGAAEISSQRSVDGNRWRQIAKTYGSGALGASALGARANLAELKGFRQAPAGSPTPDPTDPLQ